MMWTAKKTYSGLTDGEFLVLCFPPQPADVFTGCFFSSCGIPVLFYCNWLLAVQLCYYTMPGETLQLKWVSKLSFYWNERLKHQILGIIGIFVLLFWVMRFCCRFQGNFLGGWNSEIVMFDFRWKKKKRSWKNSCLFYILSGRLESILYMDSLKRTTGFFL